MFDFLKKNFRKKNSSSKINSIGQANNDDDLSQIKRIHEVVLYEVDRKIKHVMHVAGQCKNCPVYQYLAGCLTLTDWQLTDLSFSRQRAELTAARVGAILLCEDSTNQTTCICNRRNKCNDIHARAPFSTYSGRPLVSASSWQLSM